MKFKIISGCSQIESAAKHDDMVTILSMDDIQVAASGEVFSCDTSNGQSIVCIGNIAGRKTKAGFLTELESPSAYIAEAADNMSLDELVAQLEGRFILIVVNPDGSCNVRADKYSKYDIFIQKTDNGVVLSSDISMLPENPARDGYDQTALIHMLTYYGFCPPKRHTIYKSVSRLGVGETAILKEGKLSINTAAFIPVKAAEYGDREHQEYADIFLNHLKVVGSSEGNVVFLSSGWDSTSILAGLVHVFGASKVRAVTGRMRFSERSGVCNQAEIDRATKMAEYYGIAIDFVDFEYIESGQDYIEELLPLMRSRQLYAMTVLSHGKLAEKASELVSGKEVVFAGEISDGAHNLGFSQYATIFHPSYEFREYSDKMASYLFGPTFLSLFKQGEHDKDPIYNLFRSRAATAKFDDIEADSSDRTMQLLTSFFLRNSRFPLWSLDNVKLITANGGEQYTNEMQKSYLREAAEKATPETIYSWYLHLYNSFHWQGGTVRSLQTQADRYGLASDLPFWDGQMQEFLSAMPEEWGRGLDLNNTKFPLKHMLKNKIDYPYEYQKGPHAYTYDTDHSFNHIEEIFFHSKMKPVMQKALTGKPYHQILSADCFDLEYIDKLVDDYLEGVDVPVSSLGDLVPIAFLSYVGWYGKD